MGAILSVAGRAGRRPLAVIPALTFVATATAAQQCGYEPYFVDVDSDSWSLTPEHVLRCKAVDRVGLVLAVAPFGRLVPQGIWEGFRKRTGVPVVIDGAASFEYLTEDFDRGLGSIPVAMSFHATKSFAIGEGGAVAVRDIEIAERVNQALNFGFKGSRESEMAHINGKLSEYHAAVGLAALNGWSDTRASMYAVANAYREELKGTDLTSQLLAAPDVSSSYALFLCHNARQCDSIQASLRESLIDFRFWYGRGLHRHPLFAELGREPVDVTDSIAPRLLGLPLAVDLSRSEIRRVVRALVRGAGSAV